jgi:hypothetical protein
MLAMSEGSEPSQVLTDFSLLALERGFRSIEDAGGPMVPFVLERTEDRSDNLRLFSEDRLEEGLEAARRYVDQAIGRLTMYAIVWDGYLNTSNTRMDAIFVEAAEETGAHGVFYAQPYKFVPKGLKRKNVPRRMGGPVLVQRPDSRFRGGSMSVSIDLVSVNAARDEVTLHLIAEEPWDEEGEAALGLQAKLKGYVGVAADGGLHEKYPETAGMRVSIHIRTRYPLGRTENKLVELARQQWCEPEQIELVVLPLSGD